MEQVLLAWLYLGTSFADSSQNIKPWSDLRIFTNRDQELELTMNDAATIEHLLVEDVILMVLLAVLSGGKLLLQNHQKKAMVGKAKSKYNPALLGSATVIESFWSIAGKVSTKE